MVSQGVMWESGMMTEQTIIPIFNDVSPSDVIHQAGDFAGPSIYMRARLESTHIPSKHGGRLFERLRGLPGYSGKLYKGNAFTSDSLFLS